MKNSSSRFHSHTQAAQNQENKETIEEDKQEKEEEEEEEEERARCEWDFSLSTVVSSSNTAAVSDALGVIEFDPTDSIVATGGIARKIRIYSLKSLLPNDQSSSHGIAFLDHATACEYYICTPAKIGSLRWKPGSGGRVIGSGDYDGVVMEYDLERRLPIFERDEHGGRRVWSVDYSHFDPVLGASGSDDGSLQMWDTRCEGGECVARVRPGSLSRSAAVCCVEFNPFARPIIAIGCVDKRVYGYDTRMMVDPVLVLDGHKKTVTYVKFLDNLTLVSSSIDGRLKLWNLDDSHVIRTYKGHVNSRNFVGLSVWRNGELFGCGSENNKVFVYDKRWVEPIWVHPGSEAVAVGEGGGCGHGFISSVCWRQVGGQQCTLVTGGSDGLLHVFEGKRRL